MTQHFQAPIVASLSPNENDSKTTTPTTKSYNTKLILNLDINETILIGDEAGGDSREDCLNKVISKSAFCQVPTQDSSYPSGSLTKSYKETQDMIPTHWWDGTRMGEEVTEKNIPPLYTGWDWPEGCCPYYRTSLKGNGKRFTQHEHGAMYRPIFEEMDKRLSLIEQSASKVDDHVLHRVWSHMIPATFSLLKKLSEREQDFTIVFRTFGTDLPEITKAVTAFAEGRHPQYAGFSNDKLVVSKLYKGRWAVLEGGTNDMPKYTYNLLDENDEIVASGDAEIVELLESSETAIGIQDDFDFWHKHDYAPWAGKPVWVPSVPSKASDVHDQVATSVSAPTANHHILLDDNIHNQVDDSIASVRVQQPGGDKTFRGLSGEEILEYQGLYLLRVPTIEPLLNEKWFIEQIDQAQERFAQEQACLHPQQG